MGQSFVRVISVRWFFPASIEIKRQTSFQNWNDANRRIERRIKDPNWGPKIIKQMNSGVRSLFWFPWDIFRFLPGLFAQMCLLEYWISYSEILLIIRYIHQDRPDSSSRKSDTSIFGVYTFPWGWTNFLPLLNCQSSHTFSKNYFRCSLAFLNCFFRFEEASWDYCTMYKFIYRPYSQELPKVYSEITSCTYSGVNWL